MEGRRILIDVYFPTGSIGDENIQPLVARRDQFTEDTEEGRRNGALLSIVDLLYQHNVISKQTIELTLDDSGEASRLRLVKE